MNSRIYHLKTVQLLVLMIVSLVVIGIVMTAFTGYESSIDENETLRIKETVEKYAIQCYATEGAYPPNIDYLSEHYGLIINDKFIYEYEAVAENIKPIIQVFVKLESKE